MSNEVKERVRKIVSRSIGWEYKVKPIPVGM